MRPNQISVRRWVLQRYRLAGTAFYRITNIARQLVTAQQCGWWCAPKWNKIQLDSKSLAVASGLKRLVTVKLLSCIMDEALYWQWAEGVFEVMNSGTQTYNVFGHILSCLVSSQSLLSAMKQIHLRKPRSKALLFSTRPLRLFKWENCLHLFRFENLVCCIEMQSFRCDTWNDFFSYARVIHFAVWNSPFLAQSIYVIHHLLKQKTVRNNNLPTVTLPNHSPHFCFPTLYHCRRMLRGVHFCDWITPDTDDAQPSPCQCRIKDVAIMCFQNGVSSFF